MQYIFTERAHLMCPNMNFGIVESINKPLDEQTVLKTVNCLVNAHPFLSALIGYESNTNRYYYNITSSSQVKVIIKEDKVLAIDDKKILDEYNYHVSRDWDLFNEGMLKVILWKMEQNTCVMFVFHHLLADGRAALSLAKEFAEFYVHGKKPKFVQENLISSVNDFPGDSKFPFISRMLIQKVNKDWNKEGHLVTYDEYHNFANQFLKNDHVLHYVKQYDFREIEELISRCKENQVSVNDYFMAKMFIENDTNKIIIASDLRKNLSCYNLGSLGNYATAFSVTIKKKSQDIWELAKITHKLVQKSLQNNTILYMILQCYASLNPALIDSTAISTLGGFKSKAGKFVGNLFFGYSNPNGYSITNLGKIESDSISQAFFIPPASPAIKKTQGILTVNGNLIVCTSERNI